MKHKKSIVFVAVLAILTVCCLTFIFSNSLKDSAESTDQTMAIKELLTDIARFFGIKGDINTAKLRNFAHVAEFALLGACLAAISLHTAYKKGKLTFCGGIPFVCASVAGGIVFAVIDEIIQLSSAGRACEFSDVVLDTVGVVLGVAFASFLAFVARRIHRVKGIKTE